MAIGATFAAHYTVPLHCVSMPDKEVWSATMEGDYSSMESEAANWVVGTILQNPPRSCICGNAQGAIVTQCQLVRKEGGLADLTFSFAYIRKTELWSVDMAEISKDIRTWLSSEKGGMTEQEAASVLAKIAQWEAYKDSGDYIKWQSFVYNDNGGVLTGKALKLAVKIMKGVNSYTIYAPVITKTSLWLSPPPVEKAGYIDTPTVRDGWSVIGGEVSLDNSIQWLKTAARSNPNGDGTYTLTEQWTGANEIDGDLYSTDTTGGVS